MTFDVTDDFQKLFARLPQHVQRHTLRKLRLWQNNPLHRSLRFKPVSQTAPVWSMRVSRDYRIVGYRDDQHMTWDWIGTHNAYDKLLNRL